MSKRCSDCGASPCGYPGECVLPIVVVFPDEAALRAAVEVLSLVVSEQGGREDTPYYAAERALDSALLAHEQAV